MEQQMYLFTGGNAYVLGMERDRWVKEFVQKHGEENLQVFSVEDAQCNVVMDAVAAAPFIAERRLVIVQGVPRWSAEDIDRIVHVQHPATVLLFIDQKPDKRLAGVKRLLKIARIHTFEPLRLPQLREWMAAYASEQGAGIEEAAIDALLQAVGEDQLRLAGELQKLTLLASDAIVRESHVYMAAFATGERQIWGMLDRLQAGNTAEAMAYVRMLTERGESPLSLWNIFVWMLTNLTLVAAAIEEGETNVGAIAKRVGVHPRSVQALMPLARRRSRAELADLVRRAAEYDIGLKTGVYQVSDRQSEEVLALLDRCMLACCTGD
ncbi:MAG: DNA polymerase III subunit delta [Candidatus Peribacteraceae bacterium]